MPAFRGALAGEPALYVLKGADFTLFGIQDIKL